jgi:hypothetical protein
MIRVGNSSPPTSRGDSRTMPATQATHGIAATLRSRPPPVRRLTSLCSSPQSTMCTSCIGMGSS